MGVATAQTGGSVIPVRVPPGEKGGWQFVSEAPARRQIRWGTRLDTINHDTMTLREKQKQLRKRGLGTAVLLGPSRAHVSRFEQGTGGVPSVRSIQPCCRAGKTERRGARKEKDNEQRF
jgi:hypothetical protein